MKKKVEKRNINFRFSTTVLTPRPQRGKERRTYSAVGADEATHVLDKTQDGNSHLATEADLFPDIGQSHSLRCRHQHHSVWVICLQVLHDRDIFVRCA